MAGKVIYKGNKKYKTEFNIIKNVEEKSNAIK